MQVRAKFQCNNVEANGEGFNVSLSPVVSGSPENEQFYKMTPGGSISMSTVNAEAAKAFEVGKQYYVDFTPADVPAAE